MNDELSLLLHIQKPQPPLPSIEPDIAHIEDSEVLPEEPNNTTTTEPQATEETPPQVLISSETLQAFVADMVNEELKDSRRIESFKSTFIRGTLPSLPSGTQIKEQESGNISVQTKMFGKAVCYDFAADGDPPLAFFNDCPTNDIKLDISR